MLRRYGMNRTYYLGPQSIDVTTRLPRADPDNLGLLIRAANLTAKQPRIPAQAESLRKRPRKQVVKSPWQVEDNFPSDGLRHSQRQQERTTAKVLTNVGLVNPPEAAYQTQQKVNLATSHPSAAKSAAKSAGRQLPQAAKAPQRRSVKVPEVQMEAPKVVRARAGRAPSSIPWNGSTKVIPPATTKGTLRAPPTTARRAPSKPPTVAKRTTTTNKPTSAASEAHPGASTNRASTSPTSATNEALPNSPEEQRGVSPSESSSTVARPMEFFKLPRHCSCCWRTETPTWRIGKRAPYVGADLCNACEMWQQHHLQKKLTESGKVDAFKAQFMSTYGAAATGNGMASHATEPAGASDAVHIALAQGTEEGSRFGVGRRGSHAANATAPPQAEGMQLLTSLERHDSNHVQHLMAVHPQQRKRPAVSRFAESAARKAVKRDISDSPIAAGSSMDSNITAATAVAGTSFAEGSHGMTTVSVGGENAVLGVTKDIVGAAVIMEGKIQGRLLYRLRERRTPRLTQLPEFADEGDVDMVECY